MRSSGTAPERAESGKFSGGSSQPALHRTFSLEWVKVIPRSR